MPVAEVRGVNLTYEIVGDAGPWVILAPGGRAGRGGMRGIASSLAEKGYRILLFDRRNCGSSDIGITGGESEFDEWADDLFELTRQLGAQPAVVGGSSSGCRTALAYAKRHPKAVSGLILWRISGGAYATVNLGVRYYAEYLKAAGLGGMAAVCETEFFAERIKENPRNRDILMAMDPADFIAVMTRWMTAFLSSTSDPVIGSSPADLKALTMPALLFTGNDRHHRREASLAAAELIPDNELVDLGMPVQDVDAVSLKEWQPHYPFMIDKFDAFIRTRAKG